MRIWLRLIDQKALAEFRARALNPKTPVARGMAENPDHFLPTQRILQHLL